MRDLQHWKDKVELSLDGRQVFFLFFGGAVLACLLFALGVMTGRRLEARAIALETPTAEDPLAALDELGNLEDEELTYHRALTKDGKTTRMPAAKPATSSAPAAKPAVTPVIAPKPPVVAPKAMHANASMPEDPIKNDKDDKADKSDKLPATPVVPVSNVKPVAKKPVVADKGDKDQPSGHFTLQLSAFSARKDADDLAHRVTQAGYRPFVVASDVAGKGTVYRVRLGDYASKDAAIAEKSAVESKLKVSTVIAKM